MIQSSRFEITPIHYQALCGLALTAMFLVQAQQTVPVTINAILLCAGALGIVARLRIGPLGVFLALGVGQLFEQYEQSAFGLDLRGVRSFNVQTLLLAIATLTYIIGQYRLHGLWYGVAPGSTAGRSAASLSATELTSLAIPVPLCAMLADLASGYLRQPWRVAALPPRWSQFLILTWLIVLGMFFAAQGFRYWRRLHMDGVTAQLLLQDELWNETRGEQRRLDRWLVWRRFRASAPPRSPSANG